MSKTLKARTFIDDKNNQLQQLITQSAHNQSFPSDCIVLSNFAQGQQNHDSQEQLLQSHPTLQSAPSGSTGSSGR